MAARERPAGQAGSILIEDPILINIETALFHIRRVWTKPEIMRKLREQGPAGRPVQTSSLLVVHAVAQLAAGERCSTEAAGSASPAEQEGSAAAGQQVREARDVTVGAVAERLDIDPSTASRLVGHAITAGFVARQPSPRDARRANLQLTDAGRRLKAVADRFRRAYLAELLAGWTEAERAEFARLLERFTDAAVRTPMDAATIDKIFAVAANHGPKAPQPCAGPEPTPDRGTDSRTAPPPSGRDRRGDQGKARGKPRQLPADGGETTKLIHKPTA